MRESHAWVFNALIVGIVIALTGCGTSGRPPLGIVTGTVTLDGQPLPNAAMIFVPDGPGRTSLGLTDSNGRYALSYLRDIPGANVGHHYVRITTATEENGGRELLPPRYHVQSELSADVAVGSNTINFALESK